MSKPQDNNVLGRVLDHKATSRSSFFITKFSNVPDVDFLTWIKSKDDELEIWIAKPKNWFGNDTKTPPFVFLISNFTKGYVNTINATVASYNSEIFEQENNLSFHSL